MLFTPHSANFIHAECMHSGNCVPPIQANAKHISTVNTQVQVVQNQTLILINIMLCAVKLRVLGLMAYWYTSSAFHQIPQSYLFIIMKPSSRMGTSKYIIIEIATTSIPTSVAISAAFWANGNYYHSYIYFCDPFQTSSLPQHSAEHCSWCSLAHFLPTS